MHIKLAPTYVDPATAALLPDAILVIPDAQFQMRAGSVILQLAVYANAAAAASGRAPISETSASLSPTEIALQQPAILAACFNVLMARPEFAGASLVP